MLQLESFVNFEMDHLHQLVGQHQEELQNLERMLIARYHIKQKKEGTKRMNPF